MDPARAVKARVGAARLLLQQHVAGSPLHATVSRLQAAAILEVLGQSTLSSQVRADLGGTVLGMNLHDPDKHAILRALGDGEAVSSSAKRRRIQQNWMAVHNYGTAEFWTRLQDPAVPGSCKLNLILQLAIGLGCRLPTEPSIKWMTSWWLSVAEDPGEVAKMDGGAKKAMLVHVKATFDGLRKAAGEPVVFLEKLPDNPVTFLRDSPSLYHVCFVADPPVVPAMSIQVIAAIDMTYGCRGGAAKLQPQASSHLAQAPVPLQLGDSPMERMASMMFQRMEAMATNQQRLMEMAMTGAVHRANPRPLAALAGSSQLMLRKLPTMTVGGPCLALGDAASDASGTPPPKAPRLTDEVASPTSVIPGTEDTMDGGEDNEDDGAEAADLAKMLDMMAEKKAAAVAAAAANKGKKKTTGDATGEGTVEDIGQAGAAKGKGKGKTKTTGDGTGEGIVEGTGVAGKGKGKTKSNGKLTLKIKAKPKAKVLAKAVSRAVAPHVLGCSKCRWSKGGCSQCRKPAFMGLRFS
jgi:hypothetical protein